MPQTTISRGTGVNCIAQRRGVLHDTRFRTGGAGARSIVKAGEIAYWPDGDAIAIGFGPTPISAPGEIRLASPCNIWAKALSDVKILTNVKAGTTVLADAA